MLDICQQADKNWRRLATRWRQQHPLILKVQFHKPGAYTMKSDLLASQVSFSLVCTNPGF